MEWYYDSLIFVSLLPTMLVLCIITLLCLPSTWLMRKRTCKLPPGPSAFPIIGHLHLLGKLPHQSLCELSKKHGALMSLRLGSVPVVVASSPEMARQILQKHDLAFANRMSKSAANHIYGGCVDIAFSQPNAHWKLMRRLCATELISTKSLHFFKPVRIEEIRRLMRLVVAESMDVNKRNDNNATLQEVRPKILGATNDIIMRMLLGKRFSELEGEGKEKASSIVELIRQMSDVLAAFNVGDFLPCIAWMDLQGCERRSKRLAARSRAAFEGIIHARRLAHKDGRPPNDFLDVLLQASASSDAPIHILEVLRDIIGAGTEATSFTIEWALAELLLNPEKMRIVQAEIDEVVGSARVVKEEDIDHLPFLVACVKETMCLHPVGPLLIPHKTNQACEILGFHILANTQAYVNVWAIGRDPEVWKNPTKFLPERFLDHASCVDVQGQHFELLPFGSGRRICIGWRLGLLTAHIILASLLQGFEWSIPPSHHLDMSENFNTTLSLTTPLAACATPRLPKELY